jgi:6-phosphogluconolactonase
MTNVPVKNIDFEPVPLYPRTGDGEGQELENAPEGTGSETIPMKRFTRRAFVAGVAVVAFATRFLRSAERPRKLIFIGTYTKKTSLGIYSYRWFPETGEMVEIGLAVHASNPSFLALSPTHKELYAVHEEGPRPGTVSGYMIAPLTGKLKLQNTVSSGGSAPANLTADHTGQCLFVANYNSGSVASYRVLSDGHLSEPVSTIYFPGGSVDPKRQRTAHTHCVTVSPDNKYLLVNDLGLDRIMVFHFDPKTAKLTANDPPYYSAIPGSGPRNFAFHPNGRWAYSINEMASTIDCLNWDTSSGTLTRFQNISTLQMDHESPTDAATVAVHPNGHYVYASNRGDDSITVFTVHSGNGRLTLMQRISCEGSSPRHFAVDPSGKWLVVANQDSANVVVLKCDPSTGRLSSTGKQYALDSPVCVVFD